MNHETSRITGFENIYYQSIASTQQDEENQHESTEIQQPKASNRFLRFFAFALALSTITLLVLLPLRINNHVEPGDLPSLGKSHKDKKSDHKHHHKYSPTPVPTFGPTVKPDPVWTKYIPDKYKNFPSRAPSADDDHLPPFSVFVPKPYRPLLPKITDAPSIAPSVSPDLTWSDVEKLVKDATKPTKDVVTTVENEADSVETQSKSKVSSVEEDVSNDVDVDVVADKINDTTVEVPSKSRKSKEVETDIDEEASDIDTIEDLNTEELNEEEISDIDSVTFDENTMKSNLNKKEKTKNIENVIS